MADGIGLVVAPCLVVVAQPQVMLVLELARPDGADLPCHPAREGCANAVVLQTVADQTRILQESHNESYPVGSAYLSQYVTGQLKRFGEYTIRHESESSPPREWLP